MVFQISAVNLINTLFIAAGIGVCFLCFLQITASIHLRLEVRRYAQYKGKNVSATADLSAYGDASDVHSYAVAAMQWANAAGIVTGTQQGGKLLLAPRDASTRAQVATMLMRYSMLEQ